jgi:plastocyanin
MKRLTSLGQASLLSARLVFAGIALSGLAAGSAWAAGQTHSVKQIGGRYVPDALTVKQGDILEFTNEDTHSHQVVSHTPIHTFDLGLQKTGESFKIEMIAVGDVVISCDIHPRMELIVTVQK